MLCLQHVLLNLHFKRPPVLYEIRTKIKKKFLTLQKEENYKLHLMHILLCALQRKINLLVLLGEVCHFMSNVG